MRKARTCLAGVGAAGALMGAAVIAFLAIAALVAFNGERGDFEGSGEESVQVGSSGAPPGSVTALSPTPGGGGGGGDAGVGGSGGGGSEAGVAPGSGTGTDDTGVVTPGGSAPPAPAPAPQPGGGGTAGGSPPASGDGPVGGLVDQVDDAAGGLGLDPGLGGATGPITGPVDQALQDTIPGVTGGS